MTIPFFDGHNDTLLRLLEHNRADKIEMFVQGSVRGHIDLPRARAAGMSGGFFAMFPPPIKTDLASVARNPMGDGELPPELDIADALKSTNGMAALLLQLERVGARARSDDDGRDGQDVARDRNRLRRRGVDRRLADRDGDAQARCADATASGGDDDRTR